MTVQLYRLTLAVDIIKAITVVIINFRLLESVYRSNMKERKKERRQAGAELCQAQFKFD